VASDEGVLDRERGTMLRFMYNSSLIGNVPLFYLGLTQLMQ